MKLLTIFSLALFACIIDIEAGPRCNKACPLILQPTCGSSRRPNGRLVQCTFANPCILRVHICQTRETWISRPGPCPRISPECRAIQRAG